MTSIGAVDLALWDIKGKAAGQPVYQLLGGAVRDRILSYTHATGWDVPALLDSIDAARGRGFQAIRAQSGVPGLDTVYGVSRAGAAYEPAGRGAAPTEEVWDTDAYLRHAPVALAAAREHVGPEVALLHDAHHRLNPEPGRPAGQGAGAAGPVLARGRHPRGEPGGAAARPPAHHRPAGDRRGLHHDLGVPAAHHRAADRLRPRRGHARRRHQPPAPHRRARRGLADQARPARPVRRLPRRPRGVGRTSGLATPNFAIQEYMGYPDAAHEVFQHAWSYADGHLHPGDEPGLGVARRRGRWPPGSPTNPPTCPSRAAATAR